MDSHPPRSSSSDRFSGPNPERGARIPPITWLFSGAAILILGAAATIYLREPTPVLSSALEASAALEESTAPEVSVAHPQLDDLDVHPARTAFKHPLDLTRQLTVAQGQARAWSPSAVLTSIELIVEGGIPVGAIRIEFSEALGQPVPGVKVNSRRFTLNFSHATSTAEEGSDTHERRGLPEPSCPLEVAFRSLTESGVSTQGRLGVLFAYSQKHNRPVWLLTSASGLVHQLDADNCAILRR